MLTSTCIGHMHTRDYMNNIRYTKAHSTNRSTQHIFASKCRYVVKSTGKKSNLYIVTLRSAIAIPCTRGVFQAM